MNGTRRMTGKRRRRFVLCRPHGGLNDTLSVVAHAWKIAEATDRLLVVDCRSSTFARDLSRWFEPIKSRTDAVLHPSRKLRNILDNGSCHPEALVGRLESAEIDVKAHETIDWLEWRMPVDRASGTPLFLDPAGVEHLDADVLVHESFGGGLASVDVLEKLQLTPRVARHVRRRIHPLIGHNYVGLHIRHTDLKSDYCSFLDRCAEELVGRNVVVCSDDGMIQREARNRLNQSTVFSVSLLPDAYGLPYQLRVGMTRRERDQLALNTLVDLFALAGAKELRVAKIVNRSDKNTGFGLLATALNQRPTLVTQLLRQRPFR